MGGKENKKLASKKKPKKIRKNNSYSLETPKKNRTLCQQLNNVGWILILGIFLEQASVSKESMVEKLLAQSKKPREEILAMIEQKKQKFAGLLTDDGAAFMIAKELGENMPSTQYEQEAAKLSDLRDGQGGLTLKVRLMHAFSPKTFEKNGKKGVLCNAIVADSSKEMRLTLWRDDVKKLFDEKIERGAMLELSNVSVSSYNEQAQLSIGFGGTFTVLSKDDAAFPKPKETALKLKDVAANQNNLDVFAKVLRVFEEKQFESNGKNGSVINFQIGDETKTIRAAAWNELTEAVKKLSAGDTIKIEGAYTKEGLNGPELNLGWQARIIEKPSNIEIKTQQNEVQAKKISELAESMNARVNAFIERVENGKLHYFVCPTCGKKLEKEEDEFRCIYCKQAKEPDINLVVGLTIKDENGLLRAVFFGKQAETATGISKEEMKKLLEEKHPDEIVEELNKKLAGKEITLEGRVRKNAASDETELIVQNVVAIGK